MNDDEFTTASETEAAEENHPSSVVSVSFAERVRRSFAEPPAMIVTVPEAELRLRTRRELLRYGLTGAAGVALAGVVKVGIKKPLREKLLDSILTFDDAVARGLYSEGRLVPTYSRSQTGPLMNNYHGSTPDPGYIPDWRLTLNGLAAGGTATLTIRDLLGRFDIHDQVTRLICVEGWSTIVWWGGLRFRDLMSAYPPAGNAKWARLESSVSLDGAGKPQPFFVSLDLPTARHPQTLLATHHNGAPLTVAHGAPLRLVAPMKLGLKHIKAVTQISYVEEEPMDFWGSRGYSKYDGI